MTSPTPSPAMTTRPARERSSETALFWIDDAIAWRASDRDTPVTEVPRDEVASHASARRVNATDAHGAPFGLATCVTPRSNVGGGSRDLCVHCSFGFP